MAAIANVVLMDGAATPVAHTFTPIGVKNGIAQWKDKVTGIAAAFPRLTFMMREPTKALPAHKVSAKLVVPTIDTLTNLAIYERLLSIEVVMPEQCTDLERDHIYAYGVSLLGHAILSNGVKETEAVWG